MHMHMPFGVRGLSQSHEVWVYTLSGHRGLRLTFGVHALGWEGSGADCKFHQCIFVN